MQNEQSVRDSIRTYRKMMSKFMTEKNTHVLHNPKNNMLLGKYEGESYFIENAMDMPEKEAVKMSKAIGGRYQPVSKYILIDERLKELYRALTEFSQNKETV
jgi:hypothetical protein